MMKRLMILASLGLLALAPAASAQTASAQTAAAAPVAPQSELNITYGVTARGVTAAEFVVRASFGPGAYQVNANRRITGLARAFVGNKQDYRYAVRGSYAGGAFQPRAYEHQGGKRNRLVQAAFSPEDVVTTANPTMGMGNPPATPAQRRGVMDQLTAMASLMVASGEPCARTLRVYMDGRSRFDFAMSPNGRVSYNGAGWRGQAYRCRVQFTPIAGFSDPQQPATLTFLLAPLQNGMFAPVRLEMPTEDGIAILDARSFIVRGQRPS